MQNSGLTAQFHWELTRKIAKDLRKAPGKSLALYTKLMSEISQETMAWISELHSDYCAQFEGYMTLSSLEALYRVAVIRNYLKANAKGHDLHVIYYGDDETAILRNLTWALSEKINVEWIINNLTVAEVLAKKIIA